VIASMAPDGRHAVRLRRFIGHTAANLLDVEEVTTSEGLDALAPAWDGLHERAGLRHPFLTHAFMRTFWDAYGEPGTLYVLVVRRYGQVVAIAPFARRRRTIYGVSVRAIEMLRHPDAPRSDFLLSTHPIEACGAVLEHLVRRSRDWDVLDMSHFAETSVAYREVRRIARQAGLLTGVDELEGSPYLTRPRSWEAYWTSRAPRHRSNMRNRMRRLEREGEVALETLRGGPTIKQALEDVFRLGGPALRSRPAAQRFYRDLTRCAVSEGWLRVHFLKVGERRVAAIYALQYGETHFLLRIGFHPELSSCSPGKLATMLAIERAFSEGAGEVDFLGRPDPWKREWTAAVRPHRSLFVFPDHFRARCLYVAKFGVVPRLRRSGLLRALRDALARNEEPS